MERRASAGVDKKSTSVNYNIHSVDSIVGQTAPFPKFRHWLGERETRPTAAPSRGQALAVDEAV